MSKKPGRYKTIAQCKLHPEVVYTRIDNDYDPPALGDSAQLQCYHHNSYHDEYTMFYVHVERLVDPAPVLPSPASAAQVSTDYWLNPSVMEAARQYTQKIMQGADKNKT